MPSGVIKLFLNGSHSCLQDAVDEKGTKGCEQNHLDVEISF